jgi:Ca2+-binding RTX toxin-like protein
MNEGNRTVVIEHTTASSLASTDFVGVSNCSTASTVASGGNDALTGNSGAESINGGAGDDTIYGGGNDLFVFLSGHSTHTSRATITDFATGNHIDLTGIAGIHSLADLTVTVSGGNTLLSHGAGADFEVLLAGSHTMAATDFHFA